MDLGLSGKTALITGGTSGIGLAIAQRLGAEGCSVAVCGRHKGKLDAALAGLEGVEARAFAADICDAGEVAALVAEVTKAFGGIDSW
jgi:NAD(P)-dependent dehydrogenase (short-subunit alcohol dehydrogenase family)